MDLTMQNGTAPEARNAAMEQLESAVLGINDEFREQYPGEEDPVNHVGAFRRSDNTGIIFVEISKDEDRRLEADEITKMWRERAGEIAGVKDLTFSEGQGFGGGPPLSFNLTGNSLTVLQRAAGELQSKLREYEGRLMREFNRILVVSEADRTSLQLAADGESNGAKPPEDQIAGRISVTPIGIDTEEIQPCKANSKTSNILALGSLNYPPNADGIRWFANEVFPRVKRAYTDTVLTIVGRNPPRDIRNLDARNGESINVTGYVPELQPCFEAAALMVVPVRAGGGMRVRILEGFARGIPMVTTTIGLEGIEATLGRDILVADDPVDFADAVIALLRDDQMRKNLAEHGRRLVERKYDWRRALTPLDEIYYLEVMKAHVAA